MPDNYATYNKPDQNLSFKIPKLGDIFTTTESYNADNLASIYRRTPTGLIKMSGSAYKQKFGNDWRSLPFYGAGDLATALGATYNNGARELQVSGTGDWDSIYSGDSNINVAYNPETAGIYGAAMNAYSQGSNLANTPLPYLAETPEALQNQKMAMLENATLPTSALQPGMKGKNVEQLQNWLIKNGYMTQADADTGYGTYGEKTKAAVTALQQKLGIDAGGAKGFFGPKTLAALKSPYAQGFAGAKGEAPQTQMEGMSQVEKYLPSSGEPDVVNTLMAEDQDFNSFFTEWQKGLQDYFSPKNQKTSLVDEYKALMKETGIEGIDADLLNMKKVIDGTEDDIRTEVMKAGGFATDSQVLALTNARNKTLLKNYNTLVDQRNAKAEYLNNVMKISEQDRTFANQQFDRMMNFGFKVMEYRDKMQKNASDGLNKIVEKAGYDGLLGMLKGDPYAIAKAEKDLGFTPGGLQRMVEAGFGTKTDASMPSGSIEEFRYLYKRDPKNINELNAFTSSRKTAEKGGVGGVGGVSLVDAIMENPEQYNSLTPTDKAKILPSLAAKGFKFPRNLSPSQQEAQVNAESGLLALSNLKNTVLNADGTVNNSALFFAKTGFGNVAFYLREAADIVTRIRTGAALNESEIAFYKSQVPRLGDTAEIIQSKINQLGAIYAGISGSPVMLQGPDGSIFSYEDMFDTNARREVRMAIENGYNLIQF